MKFFKHKIMYTKAKIITTALIVTSFLSVKSVFYGLRLFTFKSGDLILNGKKI